MTAGITKRFWWAILSVALMVIGALGPWATAFLTTINGTDGGGDGWIVIGAAAFAAVLLLVHLRARRRWPLVLTLLAGCLGALTAGYDIHDINKSLWVTKPEWGIYDALAGSVSLALASLALMLPRRTKAEVTEPVSHPEGVA
jgi:hypothetical protein